MQMEALNCLQAQTLGRSWQSNKEQARPTSPCIPRRRLYNANVDPCCLDVPPKHACAASICTGNNVISMS